MDGRRKRLTVPAGLGVRWRARARSSEESLSPNSISRGLKTRIVGSRIVSLRRATSTNDVALALAAEKCPDGCVVVADAQLRGRGRLGRSWHAPSGTGLLFSVVLRPVLPVKGSPALNFLGALAAASAIREACGLEVSLKWPNDIMIGEKKLGGVLAEIVADSGVIRQMVLGVGINVNMRRADFPPELKDTAASIAQELGETLPRVPLLRRVLVQIDRRYAAIRKGKSVKPLVEEWRLRAPAAGRIVRARHEAGTIEGTVAGLDEDGALLLRSSSGIIRRLLAADVTILR